MAGHEKFQMTLDLRHWNKTGELSHKIGQEHLARSVLTKEVSKVQVNDYSEKIEAIASKLAIPVKYIHLIWVLLLTGYSVGKLPFQLTMQESQKPFAVTSVEEGPSKTCGESPILTSPKLRRRFMPQSNIEDKAHNSVETHQSASVKLDAVEQIHIEKHRKLQDDLTDEMVGLAQQLKESSLMMNQSIKNTEKVMWVLDSTEAAIEHSLASTGCARKGCGRDWNLEIERPTFDCFGISHVHRWK
ncbi:hypothetical protein CsSME_00046954 [Camellia sinensis var. sinensis]